MKKIALLAAATSIVVLHAVPARAFVSIIVAGPGSLTAKSYATPVVVAPKGVPVTFNNQDFVASHNVTSDETGPDTQPWCRFFAAGACPLFWSPVAQIGGYELLNVYGIENAESGRAYTYHCVIYPSITGRLVIV
jgi:hypothetical protein